MREPRAYEEHRWGILNHSGQIWTPETFDSSAKAQAYIDLRQAEYAPIDLSKHRPARVSVVITVLPAEEASHDEA